MFMVFIEGKTDIYILMKIVELILNGIYNIYRIINSVNLYSTYIFLLQQFCGLESHIICILHDNKYLI